MRAQRKVLQQGLWLEMLVSRQCATGSSAYVALYAHLGDDDTTPGWFRRDELGLGQDQGPSVFDTMATLDATRRANGEAFRAHAKRPLAAREIEQRRQGRLPRMSPLDYQRAMKRALRQAA